MLYRRWIDTWEDEPVVWLDQPHAPLGNDVNQLAITDDERLIAISGPASDRIVVWQDGDLIAQYYGSAWNLDFNPAGTHLAAAVSHRVHIYEVVPQSNFIRMHSRIPMP